MLFVALLAIIVPLVLLVGFRLSARVGMSLSALVVGMAAWLWWQMTPLAIAASVGQGFHRALTIGLILFGAITLLKTLEQTTALTRIKQGLLALSADMRVQTVIVAFAFVALLEGISGFGTPAIVAAPLLVVLGFRPLAAAALALLGDTVSCTFGAVGTPLLVGLENVPQYSADLATVVGAQVTVFDLVIASLLPFGLVALLIFGFGRQSRHQRWQSLWSIAPWTLLIGLVYAASAYAVVRILGPEFTAIVAGAITLLVAAYTAKQRLLIPATTWRHSTIGHHLEETMATTSQLPLWRTWLPYGVVILLLIITRAIPSVKQLATTTLDAGWYSIFGVTGIDSSWAILYSPGVILLIGAIVASYSGGQRLSALRQGGCQALRTTLMALSALVPTLIMVQLFTNSGHNTAGLAAMPIFIGHALADLFGQYWLLVAPWLGGIGAFIAGSATVSTLTIAPVQVSIAQDVGMSFITVLALHMTGAAAGNVIAIHNVVAASVVVGLTHREGRLIHRLIIPALVYLSIASLIGALILLLS